MVLGRLYVVNKMVTSGLVIQNRARYGLYPSQHFGNTNQFIRPFVDLDDGNTPVLYDKFVEEDIPNSISYRKIFGKNTTADDRLFFMHHGLTKLQSEAQGSDIKKRKILKGQQPRTGSLGGLTQTYFDTFINPGKTDQSTPMEDVVDFYKALQQQSYRSAPPIVDLDVDTSVGTESFKKSSTTISDYPMNGLSSEDASVIGSRLARMINPPVTSRIPPPPPMQVDYEKKPIAGTGMDVDVFYNTTIQTDTGMKAPSLAPMKVKEATMANRAISLDEVQTALKALRKTQSTSSNMSVDSSKEITDALKKLKKTDVVKKPKEDIDRFQVMDIVETKSDGDKMPVDDVPIPSASKRIPSKERVDKTKKVRKD